MVRFRFHSISKHAAFRPALIAFACVLMVLLSGSSPAGLAGSGWFDRQIDDRVEQVEQIEAPNPTAVPMVPLAIRFSDDLHEEVVEVPEPTEEDETEHWLLEVRRVDVASFASKTGLYESSADRVPTAFLLLAFPSRGSPSA